MALLSHGLWRNRFGRDPRILGRPLLLNGVSYTVIGVLPARFWLPQPVDVVIPLAPVTNGPDWLDRGNHNGLRALARLKPGVSLAQARADIGTIQRRLERQGLPQDPTPWREIVGVVGDVKREGLDAQQGAEVFMPLSQHFLWQGSTNLVIRTAQDPMAVVGAVAREIHALDKDLPLTDVQPMTRCLGESLARRRFLTLLLGIFGVLALVLAAVGIYGVMDYTVSLRMREMGIRMALGARRADVFRLVVGQGLTLAAIGVGAGVLGSLAVTRFLSRLLFGVSATDPATFVAVALLLVAVAALASFLPARRATAGDPMLALRQD